MSQAMLDVVDDAGVDVMQAVVVVVVVVVVGREGGWEWRGRERSR
jgi:hypothetical protein